MSFLHWALVKFTVDIHSTSIGLLLGYAFDCMQVCILLCYPKMKLENQIFSCLRASTLKFYRRWQGCFKTNFKDRDVSLKEKNVFLICLLSLTTKSDWPFLLLDDASYDDGSCIQVTDTSPLRKHSDSCLSDSGEVLHTEEKSLIGNVASCRKWSTRIYMSVR